MLQDAKGRDRMAAAVGRCLAASVERGAAVYDRGRILPRLLPVAPDDLCPDDAAVARRLCRLLARALRQERTRGRAGHWTYSLDRHLGLLQAYRAERRHLTALDTARVGRPPAVHSAHDLTGTVPASAT